MLKLLKNFDTQEEYIHFLEDLRWGDKRTCPYCGSYGVGETKNHQVRWGLYIRCSTCYHRYSVTEGTIFHKSRLKLKAWFEILYYTYGIVRLGSYEISRRTGIPQGTVWKIQNRMMWVLWENGSKADLLKKILELSE